MASTITIPYVLIVVGLFAGYCTGGFIGITWGRQSAQRLVPSQVVDLLLQNGIGNLRIFSTQVDVMRAFAGSNVNLTITIFDPALPEYKDARTWFRAKYSVIIGANVRTVIVGGHYLFNQPPPKIDFAMKTLRNVQAAFDEFGHGDEIKANFIHNSSELNNKRIPSESEFRDEIKERMMEFLLFLRQNDAPFLIDLFPISDMERCGLDLSFGFADNRPDQLIKDVNGAVYRNVVEWQYDCFVWALKKLNASDIKIVITQVGWPTDGYIGATMANAERFYKYLLPWVASNKGTPMRPGVPVDVYLHALTDEPKMSYANPFMRHWGIYRSNGEPKYKIDLSGQGRDIFPTRVKAVMRMPKRWCVFDGNMTNMKLVQEQVKIACTEGDCTTLSVGASCSHLSVNDNVSYAFNVYFQTLFQDEKACNFKGLAYVTDKDPSTEECLFPVKVVRGQQLINFQSVAEEGPHGRPDRVVLVLVVSIVLVVYLYIPHFVVVGHEL